MWTMLVIYRPIDFGYNVFPAICPHCISSFWPPLYFQQFAGCTACIFTHRPNMYFQLLPMHVFSFCCPRMYFQRLPCMCRAGGFSCIFSCPLLFSAVAPACIFSCPLLFRALARIVFPAFAFLPIHVFSTSAQTDLFL